MKSAARQFDTLAFKVTHHKLVGYGALLLALGISALYLPGSPAALIWPYEWVIVQVWSILGLAFYPWTRFRYAGEADQIIAQELQGGHPDS